MFQSAIQHEAAPEAERLEASATGEVEVEDGVLVVRRFRMRVKLRADSTQREAAEHAVAVYAAGCSLYKSLCKAIEITTELEFQAE